MTNASPYGAALAYDGVTPLSGQNIVGAMLNSGVSIIRYQIQWNSIEQAVTTTSNTAVTHGPGSQTITPAVMLPGFVVGNVIQAEKSSAGNFEQVTLTAVTGTTISGHFTKNHSTGFQLSAAQPGDTPASAPGNVQAYNWSVVDDLVTTAQTNNFSIVVPLQNAPVWHQDTLVCDSSKAIIKTADTGVFLTALLQRYPANTFFAIECGNEGFNTPNLCAGMFQTQLLPLLQTCKNVIQTYSPATLVGSAAQLNKVLTNVQQWIAYFYQYGCQTYVDYLNYHYYSGNNPPDTPATQGNAGFTAYWQAIHAASVANNDKTRQIWLTETGWTLDNGHNHGIPDATVTNYLFSELTSAAYSGCVAKFFYFNLGSLAPGSGHNQNFTKLSYGAWKTFINEHSNWNTQPDANAVGINGKAQVMGRSGNANGLGCNGTAQAYGTNGNANAILIGS